MNVLNDFIEYEYMQSKVKDGNETAIWLLKMKNDDKYEFMLYENMVFLEDELPLRMDEIFSCYVSYLSMYLLNKRDFNIFQTNYEGEKGECYSTWEKVHLISEKLIKLYGKDLRYFIDFYMDVMTLESLPPKFDGTHVKIIKNFVLSELMDVVGDWVFEDA